MSDNPIAFNPDTMTLSQVKECADTLRIMFHALDRGVPPEDIVHHLERAREDFLKTWRR